MKWYVPAITLTVIALLLSALYFTRFFRNPLFKYTRSGGIAGFMEEFDIYGNGKISYRDLRAGTEVEVDIGEELAGLARVLYSELSEAPPVSIKAKPGAADFFAHRLDVSGKTFEWVDAWAAEDELPSELSDFYALISMVIEDKVKKSFTAYEVSAQKGNVSLNLVFGSYSYKINEPINVSITVRNLGERELCYTSPTPCHPDVLMSSDADHELEFAKPKFSKETICIQMLDRRLLEAGGSIENLAVIAFKSSGIVHVSIRFPPATFEQEIVVLTVPLFIHE